MLVGQGLYNNNMQHMAQANPGSNPQLMNFTFNNFNTHNHLNGGVQNPISMDQLQAPNSQQLLANLTAQGQQMLGGLGNSLDFPPGFNGQMIHPHINTIGNMSLNINNYNNIQFNNGNINPM